MSKETKLEPLPAGAHALYEKLAARIPTRLKPWIADEAKRLNLSGATDFNWPSPSDPAIANLNLSQGDLTACAVLVVLMVVQDEDQDLQSQMLEVEVQMAAKQALRSMINLMNALNALMGNLDDSEESASYENFVELQIAMDRRIKLIRKLKSLMNRISGSEDTVLNDLK